MRTYLVFKAVAVLAIATLLPLYAWSQPEPARKQAQEKSDKVWAKRLGDIDTKLNTIEVSVAEMSSRINKLIEIVGNQPVPTPTPRPPGKPSPEPDELEPREPVPDSVFEILKRNCFQCHAPPLIKEAGGGFAMFDDPSEIGEELTLLHLSAEDWVRIDYSIYSGDMPQYADPLPSQDVEEVRSYVNTFRGEIYRALGGKPK